MILKLKNVYCKRALAIALSATFFVSSVGCSNPLSSILQKKPTYATAENAEFEAFMDQLFEESVTEDTLSLHYSLKDPIGYGITPGEVTLGEWTLDDIEDYSDAHEEYDKLMSFDYGTLTKKEQRLYDVLKKRYELNADNEQFTYHGSLYGPVSGIQGNLPINMAEYQFYCEQDIVDYIALLNDVPRYFEQIFAYETKKADLGLAEADFALEDAIEQCNDFLSERDTNYLVSSFEERIDAFDGLSDAQKDAYKQQNIDALNSSVFPAYEAMIENLNSLKGRGTNEEGTLNMDQGKQYYEYLVKYNVGVNQSVDDIYEQLEGSVKDALTMMVRTAVSEPDAYELYMDHNGLPIDDAEPTAMLETLRSRVSENYPEPANVNYTVKSVQKALEDTLSPAFYMTPPVDDPTNNSIYVNYGKVDDPGSLFTTIAHEGYPGHLYQFTYFYQSNPHPLYSCMSLKGYSEGWATYAEMNCLDFYDFGENTKGLTALYQAENNLNLAVSCIADVGVNYKGWSRQDLRDYLNEKGFNGDASDDLYNHVVEEPTNYLYYYISYLKFEELELKAKKALGNKFDLVEFHKVLLDAGPCQFDILEQDVDSYIKEAK